MLVSMLKWRGKFKIDEIVHENFDAELFGKLGVVYGKDREATRSTTNCMARRRI
ncbi:hypothetical protein L226DRAFT_532054 [Lentinus tigrinus ALCF2SS1-7]|nr:hypothetical protein L226DRAFT_532054 [Lentinus tigrinus ALCF2SS1-7]